MNLTSVLGIRYIGVRIIDVFAARKLERQFIASLPRSDHGRDCFLKDSGNNVAPAFSNHGREQILLASSKSTKSAYS